MRLHPIVFVLGALGVLAPAAGCDTTTVPPNPPAFDRPESVAFFCWDLSAGAPVALSNCAPAALADGQEDLAEPNTGYALHALVTQTSTGEVAAVRMSGTNGQAGVIDSDVRIPGFTFAAVGEVPSALAISETDPKHVFVLNRGSNDLRVIAVADFRKGTGILATVYDDLLDEGSRPSDMLLTPDGTALLITLPTLGQIARVPVSVDGELSAPTLLDLTATFPAPVDLSVLPSDQLPPEYRYLCEAPPLFDQAVIPPRTPTMLAAAPEPWSMLLDRETGQVLVADRALPMIHVIDPATFTEGTPLSVSVPTRRLALSPRVPATATDTEPTERFLYAIDETDRSVFAVDYTDPARGSFGGVLTVNVVAPYDRLAVPFPARSLTVLYPRYQQDQEPVVCTDANGGANASGLDLNGVFLAVATIDGFVRFFDIFDQDTACRGTECATSANPSSDDQVVAIARHRPRIGGTRADAWVLIENPPVWETGGAGGAPVADDGTTTFPERVPNFEPIACPSPQSGVFPTEGDPRICSVRDPWAAYADRFALTFEGALPRSATGGASFDGDVLFSGVPEYCSLGVLGRLDVPADGPLAGYGGDVLVITSDLPPSILNTEDDLLLDRCEALTQRTTGGSIIPIEIAIDRAFDDGSVLLGALRRPSAAFTLDDVRECYPELFVAEVRVRDAFVVDATITGFRHPVVAAADGACVVDPARAELERGRAFFEQDFVTPRLSFRLGPRPVDLDQASVAFTLGDVPTPLGLNIGQIGSSTSGSSLLSEIVYNPVDERLYVVDQSVQGLVRLRLTPSLSVQQTFR